MCGRFFTDDKTYDVIEEFAQIDREGAAVGDKCPSGTAFVLYGRGTEIAAGTAVWGYESEGKSGLIFNARCETVGMRAMFCFDYENRRCVIPAAKFYEWKQMSGFKKQKHAFFLPQGEMFLAGIYHRSAEGMRFVILTRQAEGCMTDIHFRMPVILRKEDIQDWLFSREAADRLLNLFPENLMRRECEPAYEQMSLVFD